MIRNCIACGRNLNGKKAAERNGKDEVCPDCAAKGWTIAQIRHHQKEKGETNHAMPSLRL
jgi:NAD-dependent SIR2 family protein deacetylase